VVCSVKVSPSQPTHLACCGGIVGIRTDSAFVLAWHGINQTDAEDPWLVTNLLSKMAPVTQFDISTRFLSAKREIIKRQAFRKAETCGRLSAMARRLVLKERRETARDDMHAIYRDPATCKHVTCATSVRVTVRIINSVLPSGGIKEKPVFAHFDLFTWRDVCNPSGALSADIAVGRRTMLADRWVVIGALRSLMFS